MLDDDGKEVPGTKGYKYVTTPSALLTTSQRDPLLQVLRASKRAPRSERALHEQKERGG